MKKRNLPTLAPETVISRDADLMRHYRTSVTPSYSESDISQLRFGIFIGIQFLQDSGLLKTMFVYAPDDVETMEPLRAGDFTEEGLLFFRTNYQKYLAAIGRDFTKDTRKSVKRILERDLIKLRSEMP